MEQAHFPTGGVFVNALAALSHTQDIRGVALRYWPGGIAVYPCATHLLIRVYPCATQPCIPAIPRRAPWSDDPVLMSHCRSPGAPRIRGPESRCLVVRV